MGFLAVGHPLPWDESIPYIAAIKRRGILQFLQLLQQYRNHRNSETIKWGDELEVFLIKLDDKNKRAYVSLEAPELIEYLNEKESSSEQSTVAASVLDVDSTETSPNSYSDLKRVPLWKSSHWLPEYSSYMVEAIPGGVFELKCDDILFLLPSMKIRRAKISEALSMGSYPASITAFPILGTNANSFTSTTECPNGSCGTFACPSSPADPEHTCSQSMFLGDEVISPHPRFSTLTGNIRKRRTRKVDILVPLYEDQNCFTLLEENLTLLNSANSKSVVTLQSKAGQPIMLYKDTSNPYSDSALSNPIVPSFIYMDAMCFGMGMNCCQATFSCPSLDDARYLYDQLIVLSPLWLALTAATPFLRGLLAASDTRWEIISAAVDSRKDSELDRIRKSRFSSNSLYISNESPLVDNLELYNNIPISVEERAYEALVHAGVDALLAKHVAFLFVHDPLVIFKDRALLNGETTEEIVEEGKLPWHTPQEIDYIRGIFDSTQDFENLQSTNWNAVRFKPPPKFTAASQQELLRIREGEFKDLNIPNLSIDADCMASANEIGWRVEFRTAESQITDFENAAAIGIITQIAMWILEERPDLYIPISMNDHNMERSRMMNAVLNQRFNFRADVERGTANRTVKEYSLCEILYGCAGSEDTLLAKGGIMGYVDRFIRARMERGLCSRAAYVCFKEYSNFFYLRTVGYLPTDAAFVRSCLALHASYARDSILPGDAAYDICRLAILAGMGSISVPTLLGPFACRMERSSANQSDEAIFSDYNDCEEINCQKWMESIDTAVKDCKLQPSTFLQGNGLMAKTLYLEKFQESVKSFYSVAGNHFLSSI